MKKAIESGFKFTATKEGRKQARELFRKAYIKFKYHKQSGQRVKDKGFIPYSLIKADVKKKIKGTKLITKADIKANPGTRSIILLRIERPKKDRKRGGRPILIGKAYASDKRGKGMQVPLVSKLDRRKIQSDISESVRAFMKKKTGYKKGGDIKKLKTVAAKLQKASKAHKGQSRTLRRIISKYV